MRKDRLGEIKSLLQIAAILVPLILSAYGAVTNLFDAFWKGIVLGALSIFAVAAISQIILGFWNVSITEAEELAIDYLRKRESAAPETLTVNNKTYNRDENWWHVFGELNIGTQLYTFEVAVDSRTGTIRQCTVTPDRGLGIGVIRR